MAIGLLTKSLSLFLLFATSLSSYAQVNDKGSYRNVQPLNMLGKDESFIKSALIELGVVSEFERKYSNYGTPINVFTYNLSIQSFKNGLGNSIHTAVFIYGMEDMCTECSYLYTIDEELHDIVAFFNNNDNYIKNRNSFSWSSKEYPFDVIIENGNEIGFSVTYKWKKRTN